jgi:beta-glucuronidase
MYELADRKGFLAWSEVPVYQMRSDYLGLPTTRGAAVDLLRQNILVNGNHPSIFTWSVGNELPDRPTEAESSYFAAAARAAHALDPTRPVGYALAGHPRAGCQAAYAPLDMLGLNDYFGWYTGQVQRREDAPAYLDQMRACYPGKALVVTEFGAEANRPGPVIEKGTFAFQQDWVRYQLGVFAQRPWLAGAIYWTLQEYRVRPGWAGGNPQPTPGGVLSQKGVVAFDGLPKPAFADLGQGYAATDQYPPGP